MELFAIAFSAIFVNNFVLSRFLGICPFLGVSKKVETAVGMGVAVAFVMTGAAALTYIVNTYVLEPLGLGFMYNIMFILIISSFVQLIEIFLKKVSPVLYEALGVYLPLMATNCAILGVTVINRDSGYSFLPAVIHGFAGGVGFLLAIVVFAGIRERIQHNNILPHFQGFPIALLAASLMAMAFMGFAGWTL
ncbi:MAG: RnfABCDGE type electron transport complex subunit A [Defluviitaleaceae bacterium]|nr:RnfABCDGE type electron transport complex subunit A [Defluviitaleaceae bacterium]